MEYRNLHLSRAVSSALVLIAGSGMSVSNVQAQAGGVSSTLEEVIVTAQKREQNIQDVPISVAAFTGDMVEVAAGVNITGLNGLKPNIILQTEGLVPNVPMFSIRGMNHSDPDPNRDPRISSVIDGVYMPFVAGALLDLFDIDRLEVLRGPQGTLFGKNNTAGTINVVTARPTGEFGGKVKLGFGENGHQQYQAKINTSSFADDTLAAKVALSYREYDGYAKNLTNGHKLNSSESFSGRAALVWTPSDNFDATMIVDHVDEEVVGPAGKSVSDPNPNVHEVTISDFDPIADTETTGLMLEMNWGLGDGTLTSVIGYRELEYLNRGDFDGLDNGAGLDVTRDFDGDYKSIELRFASTIGEKFNYLVGVYYLDDQWEQANTVVVNAAVSTFGINEQDGTSYALFTQVDYDFNEKWTGTLGGRYSVDEKDYSLESTTFVGGNPISNFLATPDEDWSNFSPRVALEYRPREDLMLYASVADGYKGGGFNSRGTVEANIGPYDEETVRAYEIGWKGDWLDGTLRLNGAVFFNEYEDLQVGVSGQGSVRVENITANAGEVETSGLELELTWLPTDNLQIGATFGYLDAEYTEFCADTDGPEPLPRPSNCGGSVTLVDQNGQPAWLVDEDQTHLDLANAPELSGSLLLDMDIPLSAGVVTLHADARYTDRYNTWGRGNDPGFYRDSVTLFNAHLTFEDNDERYKVTVYGRNLSDEDVRSGSVRTGSNPIIQYYQSPREFGAEFTYHF
jgi:iron complex outermembrane receptor protein